MVKAKYIKVYQCVAPKVVFTKNWDDVPAKHKAIILKQGGLPCDGGGVPGNWCLNCEYTGGMAEEAGTVDDEYETDDDL